MERYEISCNYHIPECIRNEFLIESMNDGLINKLFTNGIIV